MSSPSSSTPIETRTRRTVIFWPSSSSLSFLTVSTAARAPSSRSARIATLRPPISVVLPRSLLSSAATKHPKWLAIAVAF